MKAHSQAVVAAEILECKVMHQRQHPVTHGFEYPFMLLRFDLSRLSDLRSPLLAANRRAIFSFFESDYLYRRKLPLIDEVRALISAVGGDGALIDSVVLVTAPRFLGYAFNPVSFYYCYDAAGVVRYHVAEVNNTFGERHPYILGLPSTPPLADPPSGKIRYQVPKGFFVSPFNHVEGDYEFTFAADPMRFDVRIDVSKPNEPPFISRVWAPSPSRAFSLATLFAASLRFARSILLTVPRILWHAQILRFAKKLPMLDPPPPTSARTFSTWWRKDS